MSSLLGMKIVENRFIDPIPKLQMSQGFNACSEEMKRSMNKFLLDRFGTYTPCYVIGDTVVCSPKHMAVIRNLGA